MMCTYIRIDMTYMCIVVFEGIVYPCADPESFARGGPTLTKFFLS